MTQRNPLLLSLLFPAAAAGAIAGAGAHTTPTTESGAALLTAGGAEPGVVRPREGRGAPACGPGVHRPPSPGPLRVP